MNPPCLASCRRGRLGPWLTNAVVALIGPPWQRRLAQGALMVPRIRAWERDYEKLSDADLKTAGLQLRGRARGGESLDKLLPEAFGLVCVADAAASGHAAVRRAAGRPASSCTRAAWRSWPPAKAKR